MHEALRRAIRCMFTQECERRVFRDSERVLIVMITSLCLVVALHELSALFDRNVLWHVNQRHPQLSNIFR